MVEADPSVDGELMELQARRRPWGRWTAMTVVPLALLVGGILYWQGMRGRVSTDNAYVQQDMVAVGAEVSGRIVDVRVGEDDLVKAGDLLFRIDPEPYELDMAQADAAIATAQADVTALGNDAALAGAEISAAQEDIAFARSKLERQEALWERGFTTKADLDAARHAVALGQEQLRQARAEQAEARARLAQGSAVPGKNPKIAAAEAQWADAALQLRRTEVRAPISGRVVQAGRLQQGQQIITNLPVVTLIDEASTYIEANFKETDLDAMKPGQQAEVEFDAYPGLSVRGHVASIGAGTGSEFSVLPAQNATGNWVKVTQRVPVRIELDEAMPRRLIAGLSTRVTVLTGDSE